MLGHIDEKNSFCVVTQESLIHHSNNITVIISLIHSHFPPSFWKGDNLYIFFNEERKACPPTTDNSFVGEQIAILKHLFKFKINGRPRVVVCYQFLIIIFL